MQLEVNQSLVASSADRINQLQSVRLAYCYNVASQLITKLQQIATLTSNGEIAAAQSSELSATVASLTEKLAEASTQLAAVSTQLEDAMCD